MGVETIQESCCDQVSDQVTTYAGSSALDQVGSRLWYQAVDLFGRLRSVSDTKRQVQTQIKEQMKHET